MDGQHKSKGYGRIAVRFMALFVLAISSIAPMLVGYTNPHFSDSETSTNNVFVAGLWGEMDSLDVGVENAKLWVCPKFSVLYNISLGNVGEEDISIDELRIGWTEDNGENTVGVIIWRSIDWPPSPNDWHPQFEWWASFPGKGSGETIDIDNYTLAPGSEHKIVFVFDSNMSEKTLFTIEFVMGDGSVEGVEVVPTLRGMDHYSNAVFEKFKGKLGGSDGIGNPSGGGNAEISEIGGAPVNDGCTENPKVENVAEWELIETWGGTVRAPVAWHLVETWTGTVGAPAQAWHLVETWEGKVRAPAAWHVVETWAGAIQAPATWQPVETWIGTLAADPSGGEVAE